MTSRRRRKGGGLRGFLRRLLRPPEPEAPPPRPPRKPPRRRRLIRRFFRRLLKAPPPERPPEPLPPPPPPIPERPLGGIGVPRKPERPRRRLRPSEFPEYEDRPAWMADAINDAVLSVEMAEEIDDRGFPPFDEWTSMEIHHGPNKSDPWEGTLTFEDGSTEDFDWGDDWLEAWSWYDFADYLDEVEAIYEDEY